MKTFTFLLSFSLISVWGYSQPKKSSNFNFGFEQIKDGKAIGWKDFGNEGYVVSLDPGIAKEGKYSAYLASDAKGTGFKAWGYNLPEIYSGKTITLSGYIKTENVTDGYAGLWMRIDPRIAFDNMNDRGVKGTTDWQKFEISLKMDPENSTKIVIGGLLAGKGKMWIDDLSVSIDKKDISKAKIHQRKIYPAELDSTFDEGSTISHISSSAHNLESLQILGLIWGYVKYYHPSVANGNHNMDYELFRVLPNILKTNNTKARNEVLVKWIKDLGFVPTKLTKENIEPSLIKLIPDLGWIEDSGLSAELTSILLNLKNVRRGPLHYYMDLSKGANNPVFKNESSYQKMTYPDTGFRLLALFRYWNSIQYYFPYKNLIEVDWKDVLTEFIPKFIAAENETKYHLRMLEIIRRINDSHAGLNSKALNEYFGKKHAAPEFSFVEDKVVCTGFYNDSLGALSPLQPGDILLSVNGEKVEKVVERKLAHTVGSNHPTQLRNVSAKLLQTSEDSIEISYDRNGETKRVTLMTYPSKLMNLYRHFAHKGESYQDLSDDIAYINNSSLKIDEIDEIKEKLKGKKGLIIDDRNYPSDFPLYQLSKALSPTQKEFVKFSNGSIQMPGLFTYTTPMEAGEKTKEPFEGKVIILVNEVTQSSAEFHAMAYQTIPNSMVIGSTTAGADGNVSLIKLPGGLRTMISGIGVYYPNGRETQRIGIVPDVVVKPTIQGIKEGKDEVLEKAIELINQG